MHAGDVIAPNRECCLDRELVAAARDDIAVDGVEALTADALTGVHDPGREPPLLSRQRAEGDRHGASGLCRERRKSGGARRRYAVDLEGR